MKKARFSQGLFDQASGGQAVMPALLLMPSAVPSRISPIRASLNSALSDMFSATQDAATFFAASASSADSQALNEMSSSSAAKSEYAFQAG